MYRKISAIVIPTLIAIGIIAYMLYRVWDELLHRSPESASLHILLLGL